MGSFSFLSRSDREKIDGTEDRADENTRTAEQMVPGGLADFPAKLTDYDEATGYYSWTRRKWLADRSREDSDVAIQVGTPTSNPARYPNGDVVDVSAGVDVWLRPVGVNPDVGMVHEVLAASGSGGCFLAALTAKAFDASTPFITFSWTAVTDSYSRLDPDDPASPLVIVYTKTDQSGGPGDNPLYHEQRDVDLVVSAESTHEPTPGVDCNCVGKVTAKVDNGDGTFTWTFDNLKCCRIGTVVLGTGACTACADTTPCSTDPVSFTDVAGTYPNVNEWADLGTLCRQPADEAPPGVIVRICKGIGAWYFVDHEPRMGLVAVNGNPSGTGVFPGVTVRVVPGTTDVVLLNGDVEVIDINANVGP